MTRYHPLRESLGQYVLVCEGEFDQKIISLIWENFSPSIAIQIQYAMGDQNLKLLAAILKPSVIIEDRDFKCSDDEALTTFTIFEQLCSHYWKLNLNPDKFIMSMMDTVKASLIARQDLQGLANDPRLGILVDWG
jgi:hypothetical protein